MSHSASCAVLISLFMQRNLSNHSCFQDRMWWERDPFIGGTSARDPFLSNKLRVAAVWTLSRKLRIAAVRRGNECWRRSTLKMLRKLPHVSPWSIFSIVLTRKKIIRHPLYICLLTWVTGEGGKLRVLTRFPNWKEILVRKILLGKRKAEALGR